MDSRNLTRIQAAEVEVGDLAYNPAHPEEMPMFVGSVEKHGRFVVLRDKHLPHHVLSLVSHQTMQVVH
jgi:hypothetical protein